MIARFDTWERASVFAAEMQDEGRHAVILDEGTCFIWGPLAIGGVRVAVSDIVLDEDGEWPEIETVEGEFKNVARGMFIAVACAGPLLLLAKLASEHARPGAPPADPAGVLVGLLSLAGVAATFAVLGSMMPAFTRFIRDEQRVSSRMVRLIIAIPLLV